MSQNLKVQDTAMENTAKRSRYKIKYTTRDVHHTMHLEASIMHHQRAPTRSHTKKKSDGTDTSTPAYWRI